MPDRLLIDKGQPGEEQSGKQEPGEDE